MKFRGPVHVDFNLTNGCNLACSHCHSSSGPKLDNELKTEEILDVITEIYSMGVLRIAFAGGEPFIRRDIIDILSHACSFPGWQVSVISNGLFFTERNIKLLKEKCPNLNVNISLDGSTAENYSILRKQVNNPNFNPVPLFEKVVKSIKDMVKAGFNTSVNFTLTKATIEDWIPTYELVNDLGAHALVGIKFFPGGYGKEHLEKFELPYDLWSSYFTAVTREKLKGKYNKMQISVPAAWEFYLPFIQGNIDIKSGEDVWNYRSPLQEKEYRKDRSVGDIAGVAELSISSNGDVYPSILLIGEDELLCGNLREENIQNIWNGSEVLRSFKDLDIELIQGMCNKCGIKEMCGGGSRSRAFAGIGNILAEDYTCPLVKGREVINV